MQIIVKALGIAQPDGARWEVKNKKFQAKLPKLLKSLPLPSSYSAAEYDTAKNAYDAAMEEMSELAEQNDQLKAQVQALEAVKDAAGVKRVRETFSNARKQLEALEQALADHLERFSSVVSYIAFRETAHSEQTKLNPYEHRSELSDADRAVSKQFLNVDEGDVFSLNRANIKVRKMLKAHEALREFLEDEGSEEIRREFEEENEFAMDIDNIEYWGYALDARIKNFS